MRYFLIIIIGSLFLNFNFSYAGISNKYYAEYLLTDPSKRVSMDFEDADLIDVLKALSQQVGLNFICPENIRRRKITCYFENVTLKQAFDSLLKANNLTYEFLPESNIFIVKELGKPEVETITKVYRLKYTRVSNSKLDAEINSQLGGGTEGEGREGGGTEGEEGEGGEGGEESRYAALKEAIRGLLSDVGKLVEDPRTNSLIITDRPARFPAIEKLIKELDTPVPQVMIEAEILDVSKELLDKLGFNYGETIFTYTGPTRYTHFPFPPSLMKGAETRKPTLGEVSFANFSMMLDFIRKDASTKFLARPRILTLSNETAEIKITRNEAIGKKVTISEETVSEEPERAETGVTLRVTPQVNLETGEITMIIVPTVSEAVVSPITLITQNGVQQTLKDPEKRIFKSVLTIKDGETVVLSGLIRNKVEERITHLPLLGDLPLIGSLFRHKEKEKRQRELLVFITPKIVWPKLFQRKFTFALQREQFLEEREKAIKEALKRFEK